MKSWLKRFRCWLSGHKWEVAPITPWECYVVCPRCGKRENLIPPKDPNNEGERW